MKTLSITAITISVALSFFSTFGCLNTSLSSTFPYSVSKDPATTINAPPPLARADLQFARGDSDDDDNIRVNHDHVPEEKADEEENETGEEDEVKNGRKLRKKELISKARPHHHSFRYENVVRHLPKKLRYPKVCQDRRRVHFKPSRV